ncbi:hypothetical protein HHI36_009576 [Cryptolaemus montrouzieri]|uniref:Uncharacterized protein n=1 Tax=Cryptolaemus montrouzieri TaxID=559131 RepID=A0ABD2MG58_9CUCU
MVPPPLVQAYPQMNYQDILGMRAPPIQNNYPTTQLHSLSKNPHNIQDILQPPVSQYSILNEDFPPYTRNPLGNDNSPVHGIEQLPLSSGDSDDYNHPIVLPNLSITPLVPIHNFGDFRKGIPNRQKLESVQILPSVPVADYISSIEHPINVIQSPLVDLSIRNESQQVLISNQQSTYHSDFPSTRPNVIQSGLFVNPAINTEKLNTNPIVVDDTHTAASSVNNTYKKNDESDSIINSLVSETLPLGRENINEDLTNTPSRISHADIEQSLNKNATRNFEFTQPPMDYSQWTPTWSGISMEISPPPLQSTWLTASGTTESPPKKTKHVQIIVPYYNFNKTTQITNNFGTSQNNKFSIPFKSNYDADAYTTLLPVYKPPVSTEQSLWSQFLNDLSLSQSERVTATAFQPPTTTKVYNIQDLLGHKMENHVEHKLPFDVLSFQKNIDEWTQQAYAKTTAKLSSRQGVLQALNPSKKIPDEYLTTVPYDYTTTKPLGNYLVDHETAGSLRNEKFEDDIGNNLILEDVTSTTEETSTFISTTEQNPLENKTKPSPSITEDRKSLWNVAQVTVSPVTKEKVYIVTPASVITTTFSPIAWSLPPKIENGSARIDRTLLYEHPKFSIRIEENATDTKSNTSSTTKVIYSEWPHKINNLQTTSTRPTSRHPLFGLMDVSAYKPPENRHIETIDGHSKVLENLIITKHKRSENKNRNDDV